MQHKKREVKIMREIKNKFFSILICFVLANTMILFFGTEIVSAEDPHYILDGYIRNENNEPIPDIEIQITNLLLEESINNVLTILKDFQFWIRSGYNFVAVNTRVEEKGVRPYYNIFADFTISKDC